MKRAHTSESKVRDLRRPDRRTAMKVLVKKSFRFVDTIWAKYLSRNHVDTRSLCACVHVYMYSCIMYIYYYYSELDDEPIGGDEIDYLTDGMLPHLQPCDDMDSDVDSDDDKG